MKSYNNNIGTLRFLGAFFVLVGHTFVLSAGNPHIEDPISNLIRPYTAYHLGLPGIGVSLFFVLSGFLVTRSYATRHNIFEYAESRILRIFPALVLVVFLTVFVLGPMLTDIPLADYFQSRGTWAYLIQNSTLIRGIHFHLPGMFEGNPWKGGVNGSLWTLPIELWMYIWVAVLGLFAAYKSRPAFNLFVLLTIFLYILGPDKFLMLPAPRFERLGIFFLMGAFAYMNWDRIPLSYPLLATLVLFSAAVFSTRLYPFAFSIALTYFVLLVSYHPSIRLPDLGKHGDFSYGLYLYAFPVQQTLIHFLGGNRPWLVLSLCFPITLFFAIASWHLIEKHALSLKGTLSARLTSMYQGYFEQPQ